MDIATIETKLKGELSWLQKHERLVLAVIAGLVLWFGIGRIDTLIAHHDQAQLAQATEVAKVQADKNTALTKQAQEQAAQYQALAAQVTAQNAQLEQANLTLTTALTKQQKMDASLPPSELVNRWSTLVPQAKPTVTPTGVALDTPSAVATVQALEELPVLRTQNEYERTQIANTEKLVTAEGVQVTTLNAQVDGLKLQLTDDAKVCKAEVATVKATARRSKRKWFYAGMVVGFIGRQLIKSETGF